MNSAVSQSFHELDQRKPTKVKNASSYAIVVPIEYVEIVEYVPALSAGTIDNRDKHWRQTEPKRRGASEEVLSPRAEADLYESVDHPK